MAVVMTVLASAGYWSCAKYDQMPSPRKALNEQETILRGKLGIRETEGLEGSSVKERVVVA